MIDFKRADNSRIHFATYPIWLKSISIRYFLELLITGCLLAWLFIDFDAWLHDKQDIFAILDPPEEDDGGGDDGGEDDRRMRRRLFRRGLQDDDDEMDATFDSTVNNEEEGYDLDYEPYNSSRSAIEELGDLLQDLGVKTIEINFITLLFTFSFFLTSVLRMAHAKLTKRPLYIGWIALIDFLLLIFNLIWSGQVAQYLEHDNPAFFVSEEPTEEQKVGAAIFYVSDDNEVKPIKVIVIFLFWLRFIFMLQMTRLLGPLIQICRCLFVDFAKFFALYAMFIVLYVGLGMLMFDEVEEF